MRFEAVILSALAIWATTITNPICRAGPVEDAISAAMALSDEPGYSWNVTVADDAQSYLIEGKTRAGGWNWVRQPMVRSVALRMGREAEPDLEAVFKGTTDAVVRTARGWRRLRELSWIEPVIDDNPPPLEDVFPGLRSPRMLGTNTEALSSAGRPVSSLAARGPQPYCNAQFGVSPPHQELAVIVSSFTSLDVDGEVAAGTLDDAGARLLLVRDGQADIVPLVAQGEFKLTIRNGQVASYLLELVGVLEVNEGGRHRRVLVHQNSNTVISDVGTTDFQVPAEAWKKLGP